MTYDITQQKRLTAIPAAFPATRNVSDQNFSTSKSQLATTSPSEDTTNLESADSLSRIAQKYNVRNISPREMSVMSQDLYQGGFISFQDHALLSFQPDLGDGYPGATNRPETPKDFIAHWEQQLKMHEQQGELSFAEKDRKILNILGNLDAISKHGNAQADAFI
ncbi:hypothetical protein [Thiorhodococcus fuscus]|uniref:Uncharacterized protein n=1 Tax=Thiorhodococcus fuscus TaxID=527200 RepID=A0ABW4Y5X5_9GAMM